MLLKECAEVLALPLALIFQGSLDESVLPVEWKISQVSSIVNLFFPTVPTFAVRETASLGIMGAPRVPPSNPSESIVL